MVLVRWAALSLVVVQASQPKAPEVTVPWAPAPKIDGVVTGGEWSAALVANESGGKVLLQHDGERLYVAAVAATPQIVTVFLGAGDEVRVLHASARLGEARYRRKDPTWTATREFEYSPPSPAFLAKEKWIANTIGAGGKGATEFAIDLPAFGLSATDVSKRASLAVSTLAMASPSGGVRWPAGLDDETGNAQLLMGYAPSPLRLSPSRWTRISFAERPASRPAGG